MADGDEDELTFPAAWKRVLLPRRGGRPGPAITTNARTQTAAEAFFHHLTVAEILAHPRTDPDLAAAARAWLDDRSRGTPLGAAVAFAAVTKHVGWDQGEKTIPVADAWVAWHGVAFAAEVAVELTDLVASWDNHTAGTWVVRSAVGRGALVLGYLRAMAGRVRAHLAAAPDETYHQAVAAVAGHRGRGNDQRMITSFLVPTERAWVAQDVAALPVDSTAAAYLFCAVDSREQAEALDDRTADWLRGNDLSSLVTAVDGIGPAIAPVLAARFRSPYVGSDIKQRVLSVLAAIPSDEAFDLVLDRLGDKYVTAAVASTARPYPVRALRRLAERAANEKPDGPVATLLRGQVVSHPELVEVVRERVSEAAWARIAAVADVTTRQPAAEPDMLPPLLVTPPWTVKAAPVRPVVVDGLVPRGEDGIVWLEGEEQAWRAVRSDSVHDGWRPSWESSTLERFTGAAMPTGKVVGLERRGWRRGDPMDGGVRRWMQRTVPGDRAVVANLDPGIPVGTVDAFPQQSFTAIWLNDRPYGDWRRQEQGLPLGQLDPVTASEILRDLSDLRE